MELENPFDFQFNKNKPVRILVDTNSIKDEIINRSNNIESLFKLIHFISKFGFGIEFHFLPTDDDTTLSILKEKSIYVGKYKIENDRIEFRHSKNSAIVFGRDDFEMLIIILFVALMTF